MDRDQTLAHAQGRAALEVPAHRGRRLGELETKPAEVGRPTRERSDDVAKPEGVLHGSAAPHGPRSTARAGPSMTAQELLRLLYLREKPYLQTNDWQRLRIPVADLIAAACPPATPADVVDLL